MAKGTPGKPAITVYPTPAQLEEIDALSATLKISRTEWFRRLLLKWLAERKAPGQKKIVDRRPLKERFLDSVADKFHLSRAAALVGVPIRQVHQWMAEDPDYQLDVEEAQQAALDEVEGSLVSCATGELELSKAAVTAAFGLLNAHHYAWGRVKVEFINRIVNPLVELLLKILADELGPGQKEVIERIATRFAKEKELRLSAFSE